MMTIESMHDLCTGIIEEEDERGGVIGREARVQR